jgi:ABC-type dipeptide/oligopeptide/nickel transport system ATPase component
MAVILITHDLGVVARVATTWPSVYAGEIIETGTASRGVHTTDASLHSGAAALHSDPGKD